MKSSAKLKLVSKSEPPIDIALLIRADAEKRDWSRVHIAGDRRQPLAFWHEVRRNWR